MAGNNPAMVVRVAATIEELRANLKEGVSQIETTTAAMQKMAAGFQGDRVVQAAHNVAAAITEIGGVSKLTESELARVNVTLERALEKYAALGKEAPAGLRHLAEETKATQAAWQGFVKDFDIKSAIENPLSAGTNALTAFAESLGPTGVMAIAATGVFAALGAAAFELADRAAQAGDQLGDLSDKTGVSVPALSRYQNALAVTGHDLGVVTNALFLLQKGMGEHSEKLEEGLKRIGLSAEELRDTNLDEWLLTIAQHFEQTTDPGTRAAAVMEIFGKAGRELLPTLLDVAKGMEATSDITPWTAQQAKDAEAFEVQMKSLKIHVESLGLSFGRDLINPIGEFVGAIVTAGKSVNEYLDLTGGVAPLFNRVGAVIHWTAAAVDVLTGSIEENAAQIDNVLKPALDRWNQAVKDRAAAPLKLTLGEEKRIEDELTASVHQSVAAEQKFAAVMEELNSVGQGWQGTLATIDGETVAAIKYYLEAGVAQDKLATAYGLTAVQVKAVSSALKEEQDALKVLEDFHTKTHGVAMKAMRDEEEARARGLKAMNDSVIAAFQVKKAIQDKADEEYRKSLDVLIGGAKEVGAANQDAAKDCQVGYAIAFHDAGGGFAAFKGAVLQGNEEMIASTFGLASAYAAVLNPIGTPKAVGGQRVATSADIAAVGSSGFRAAGGPVASGAAYVVGERGPELFVPDRAGSIVPNGGGSIIINAPITINGSVLSGKRELAAAVGDALQTSLRASGVRLPSR